MTPPSEPLDVSLNLAFNDLINTNVGNGNTIIELIVKDPKQTTTTNDFNSSINLVGVKLEYANTDTNNPDDSDWSDVKKIYFKTSEISRENPQITISSLDNLSTLTNGVHNINRLNDHGAITDADTNTKYYYYIKLNNEFLDATDNQFKKISFF